MSEPASWPDPDRRPAPEPPPPPYPGAAAGPQGMSPPPPPPGYGYHYGFPPPMRTNGTAVASMSVSIGAAVVLVCYLCLFPLGLISLPAGVTGAILGHVASRQVRERHERGRGMALAGIIVGWTAAGLSLLAGVAVVLAVVLDVGGSSSDFQVS